MFFLLLFNYFERNEALENSRIPLWLQIDMKLKPFSSEPQTYYVLLEEF